ncbi:probable methyltransferase At1g29790 [Nymphaea colorata]|nr:probable methyltransferase At1g29790 [Nymphaea colorata]
MDASPRSFSNNLCFLLLCVLISNLLTLSLFSSDSPFRQNTSRSFTESLLRAEEEIDRLRDELRATRSASGLLLQQLSQLASSLPNGTADSPDSASDAEADLLLPKEYLEFVSPKKLPLGRNSNFGSDHINPPAGRACDQFPEDLARYMNYTVGGPCPDDELLAQRLLLRGCEPLPRRRCRSPPALPARFVEPAPFPASLWSIPDDSSVVWTAYACKNYSCLVDRKNQKGFDDCKDCFDLGGRESRRWVGPVADLDYSIDDVLAYKKGTVRIGLDIGGGTGTFAVRMRERNVTIVTTSMNFNGPFNNFIASRGVVPLYLSISQRLPFFDGTLDIVHSMHVLSNWIPTRLLEFALFDIYRVLRPGGVFWLDHFFCLEDQMHDVYVPMIDAVGFKRVKWTVGRKLDRGPQMRETYISALLEKPMTAGKQRQRRRGFT